MLTTNAMQAKNQMSVTWQQIRKSIFGDLDYFLNIVKI